MFPELTELLRNRVDRWLVQYMESAPEFYNEYQSARVVVNAATGSALEESGVVTLAHGGEHLEGGVGSFIQGRVAAAEPAVTARTE